MDPAALFLFAIRFWLPRFCVRMPPFESREYRTYSCRASEDFDRSEISPTTFGAVFESTLNPETRRSGGMHYTSIEIIFKLMDPLFLDGLRAEFSEIVGIAVEGTR